MQILKICEVCGNQFVGIKRTAKYCSKPCREGAMKERHKILQAEKAERADMAAERGSTEAGDVIRTVSGHENY